MSNPAFDRQTPNDHHFSNDIIMSRVLFIGSSVLNPVTRESAAPDRLIDVCARLSGVALLS
jgi:hypothetical protein